MTKIRKLIHNIPYQIRASLVILISSFITSAFGFLTTPIFTRLMTVEEYGLVVQYNSVLEVVMVIATFSVSAGVFQVAMNEFPEERSTFTFSALLLSNLATAFSFLVIFPLREQFSSVVKLTPSILLCMFIYLIFYPAFQLWIAKQRYEYQYKQVALVSIFSVAFNLGLGIIAVVSIKGKNLGEVKIWATAIAQILSSCCIYYLLGKNANWRIEWRFVKYAFTFNAPLLIHYLAQYVLRSSDKMMITTFCGERATGLYGLGSTVASIAIMAWAAMAASLTPYMYSHISSKEYAKVNKAAVSVITIFGICCVGVAVVGPEIVYLLGSKKYMENIQLIPPIAASSLLTAIYGIYSTVAFYYHKRTSTAILTIIAAATNIILNLIFIPRYGYIAAAYTTEGSYLIYTFLHFLNYRRIAKGVYIFKDAVIWMITLVVTCSCLFAGLLYEGWIIRYSILGIAMIIFFIQRRKIITIVRSIYTF